jgi:drug/metabolite transporter (DMT)-like permease
MRMSRAANPADSMLIAHILTALISLPFWFISPPEITATTLTVILYMGLVQIGLASLLFTYGIKRIPAVEAMLTCVIEPVLNPVWVLIVTGEVPGSSALLGGAVIIGAVVFCQVSGRKKH